MTRQTVDQMIAEIIRKEGGYSDHPADKGGETNMGITASVARENGYAGPMRDMPRGVAEAIYRKRYFIDPGYDRVHLLSAAVAEELFDTAVNMGPKFPGEWLQRWLNAMNDKGAPLEVDGKIGPATVLALRAFLQRRGLDGEKALVRGLNCLQGVRYLTITEARPANKAFIYGWLLNRVA